VQRGLGGRIGNTLFVLLHEMGHVLINEMNLPVLGRQEDTADTYATLRMLAVGSSFSLRGLAEAAKGWFLTDRRDQQTGAEPLYYGEHSLSQQRAYQIVCLMVGSDPAKFKSLADGAKMPGSRQEKCKEDYALAASSWDMVLKPHRRGPDQPETKINVVYRDGEGRLEGFSRAFRSIRMLEAVAQRSSAELLWPNPFTLETRSCGGADAAWTTRPGSSGSATNSPSILPSSIAPMSSTPQPRRLLNNVENENEFQFRAPAGVRP
jgi:hypothetical protein